MNKGDIMRAKYGDDYYSRIRRQRKTKPAGTIQNLTPEQRTEMGKRGAAKRWEKPDAPGA